METKLNLGPAGETFQIEMVQGEQVMRVHLSADEVSRLLGVLRAARRAMAPEVARTLPPTLQGGEVDPLWAVSSQAHAPDKILSIRDTGFGWLSFLFPEEQARLLSASLSAPNPTHPTRQ